LTEAQPITPVVAVAQLPLLQVPLAQTLPQRPQFALLVLTSTQLVPHAVCPTGHPDPESAPASVPDCPAAPEAPPLPDVPAEPEAPPVPDCPAEPETPPVPDVPAEPEAPPAAPAVPAAPLEPPPPAAPADPPLALPALPVPSKSVLSSLAWHEKSAPREKSTAPANVVGECDP